MPRQRHVPRVLSASALVLLLALASSCRAAAPAPPAQAGSSTKAGSSSDGGGDAMKTCGDFGEFIEGAAVDKRGRFLAVNGANQRNTIAWAGGSGVAAPACGVLATVDDQPGTILNGIRVLPDGSMLAADKGNARIVKVSSDGKAFSTYCSGGGMVESNDLALTSDGRVYVSGQRWGDDTKVGDGGVWLCKGPGAAPQQLWLTGRTNGIELSPDEKHLYVSEAFNKGGAVVANKLWRFELKPDGGLGAKMLFKDFATDGSAHSDIDGVRVDTAGNLYVTRYADGKIVVLSPSGATLRTIQLPLSTISNVELGGPDGKTVIGVGRCAAQPSRGCVGVARAEGPPGRAWSLLQAGQPARLG